VNTVFCNFCKIPHEDNALNWSKQLYKPTGHITYVCRVKKRTYDKARVKKLTTDQRNTRRKNALKYSKTPKGKANWTRANKKKYSTILGKLESRVRSSMRQRFLGKSKSNSYKLPFNILDLKVSLSSKFRDGMTWDNIGRWHVDHIIPLKYKNLDGSYYWNQLELADYTTDTFKRAWGLDNLQPLWARDNLIKNNRIAV